MATIDDVKASYKAVIRVDLNDAAAAATAAAIDGGQLTLAQYQNSLIQQSAPTTQAALLLSSLITGTVPTSDKLDSLTAFAKTQNDYYTNVLKSSNAQLGAYEALGRAYASDATTAAAFSARFGALSTTDFVTAAYATAFNTAPSAGAAANLIAQVNYFTSLYTAAGIPAAEASLQAKGAVFGQIVGYAATAPATGGTSTLDDQAIETLQTIANQAVTKTESTVYGKALPGVSGATLTIAADESISLDSTVADLKSTTGNDTVSGTISSATKNVSVNTAAGDDSIGTATSAVTITENAGFKIAIDGSAGNDVLYGTIAADLATTTIANVEKVYLGASAAAKVDAANITGANEIWSYKTAAGITFDNVAAGVSLGVDSNTAAANSTFNLKAEGAATLSLKNATASTITVDKATALTVNVVANSTATLVADDAKTVTISGDGNLVAADVTFNGALSSIDASASKGFVAIAGVDASTAALSVKLTGQADQLGLAIANTSKAVTITTGAGADQLTITGGGNVGDADITKSVINTITDFTSKSDTLTFDLAAGGAEYVLTAGDKTAIGGLSLTDALNYIANKFTAGGDGAEFTFGGDSYVFADTDGSQTFSAGDTLIKLTGVTSLDAADISFV